MPTASTLLTPFVPMTELSELDDALSAPVLTSQSEVAGRVDESAKTRLLPATNTSSKSGD